MKYKIKFANIEMTDFVFYYAGIIKSVNYDLENMEMNSSTYTIKLPKEEVWNVLQEDDRFTLDMENAPGWDGSNYYIKTDGTSLSTGDYVWVRDELMQITGYSGSDVYTVNIGQNGTREFLHCGTLDAPLTALLNGRQSPIGLECVIVDEDDVPVFLGFVTEVSSEGAGVSVTLEELITKMFRETRYNYNSSDSTFSYDGMGYLLARLSGWSHYKLRDASDHMYSYIFNMTGAVYDVGAGDYDRKGTTLDLGEILNSSLKMNNQGLKMGTPSYADSIGYSTYGVDGRSTFSPLETDDLLSTLSFDGSYRSFIGSLFSSVKITYYKRTSFEDLRWGSEEHNHTLNASTLNGIVNGAKMLEVSLDNIFIDNEENIKALGRKLVALFGIIYGRVEMTMIPSSSIEVGKFYNIGEDLDIFFGDAVAGEYALLCVGVDELSYKFFLVKTVQYHPVAPSFYGTTTTSGGSYYIELEEEPEQFTNFPISASSGDMFFTVDDHISVYDIYNVLIGEYTITGIIDNTVFKLSASIAVGERVIVTYVDKSDADRTVSQAKFLYNSEGTV